MSTTVQKWGNSLGVRIPKGVAAQVNLTDGTEVEFETAGGVLTIRPARRRRRTKYKLSDLLAKMKGPNPHGEMFGRPVGREIW
jgi:antitoxin MazE